MRHTVGPCLILAIAAHAAAQSAILVDIEHDRLLPGQRTTVTLWAAWPEHEYAFASARTSLLSSVGSEGWSDARIVPPMDGPGTTAGLATGMGYEGIVAWQLNFPPAGAMTDRSNPIDFWRATYTAPLDMDEPFEIDLTTRSTAFEVYFRVWDIETHSYLHELVEGNATIRVIPAPATTLILAGLALTARRRR